MTASPLACDVKPQETFSSEGYLAPHRSVPFPSASLKRIFIIPHGRSRSDAVHSRGRVSTIIITRAQGVIRVNGKRNDTPVCRSYASRASIVSHSSWLSYRACHIDRRRCGSAIFARTDRNAELARVQCAYAVRCRSDVAFTRDLIQLN